MLRTHTFVNIVNVTSIMLLTQITHRQLKLAMICCKLHNQKHTGRNVPNKWTELEGLIIHDHHFSTKSTAIKKPSIPALSRINLGLGFSTCSWWNATNSWRSFSVSWNKMSNTSRIVRNVRWLSTRWMWQPVWDRFVWSPHGVLSVVVAHSGGYPA